MGTFAPAWSQPSGQEFLVRDLGVVVFLDNGHGVSHLNVESRGLSPSAQRAATDPHNGGATRRSLRSGHQTAERVAEFTKCPVKRTKSEKVTCAQGSGSAGPLAANATMVFSSRPPTCSGLGFSDSKSKGGGEAYRPLTRAAVHSPKGVRIRRLLGRCATLLGLGAPVYGPPLGPGLCPWALSGLCG